MNKILWQAVRPRRSRCFFRSSAHAYDKFTLGNIAVTLLARSANAAISGFWAFCADHASKARCDGLGRRWRVVFEISGASGAYVASLRAIWVPARRPNTVNAQLLFRRRASSLPVVWLIEGRSTCRHLFAACRIVLLLMKQAFTGAEYWAVLGIAAQYRAIDGWSKAGRKFVGDI